MRRRGERDDHFGFGDRGAGARGGGDGVGSICGAARAAGECAGSGDGDSGGRGGAGGRSGVPSGDGRGDCGGDGVGGAGARGAVVREGLVGAVVIGRGSLMAAWVKSFGAAGQSHRSVVPISRNMMTKTKKRVTKRTTKSTTKSKKAPSEQRTSERSKLMVAASVYPDRLSPDNLAHKVWVTNISLGGVAFKTRRKYDVGSSCYIRLDAG